MAPLQETRMDRTRLYRFGWLAMKFEGRPGREVSSFFERHFRVQVSQDAVERAVEPIRAKNTMKRPRGPASEWPRRPEDTGFAIWTDWLRVDEQRLGIRTVLVRIPNDGYPIDGLVEALETEPGVRQVIETKEMREVFAVALLRTEEDEDDLRARILEHAQGRAVSVTVIRRESHVPTASAWLNLACDEARAIQEAEEG